MHIIYKVQGDQKIHTTTPETYCFDIEQIKADSDMELIGLFDLEINDEKAELTQLRGIYA